MKTFYHANQPTFVGNAALGSMALREGYDA